MEKIILVFHRNSNLLPQIVSSTRFFKPDILTLKDKFVKRCRAISQKIVEESTEIEGEWLTREDMELLKYSECLTLICFFTISIILLIWYYA